MYVCMYVNEHLTAQKMLSWATLYGASDILRGRGATKFR